MKFWKAALLALVLCLMIQGTAYAVGVGNPVKKILDRDDTYYEISNDVGDHGNFIETYHIPNGRGGTVYCIVYSDKIGDGGGAGIDCDWTKGR